MWRLELINFLHSHSFLHSHRCGRGLRYWTQKAQGRGSQGAQVGHRAAARVHRFPALVGMAHQPHQPQRPVTDRLGISTPQASADVARYQELALTTLTYDSSSKCYLSIRESPSAFDVEDSDRYLAHLHSIANRTIRPEEAEPPDFRVVPAPGRSVDTRTLKAFLSAIREREAIWIRYRSMSKPDPQWRWITSTPLGSTASAGMRVPSASRMGTCNRG